MMKVRKAVFPAAGLGTRFLPATKAQPKEMLPLVDKPIIQYVFEETQCSVLATQMIEGDAISAYGVLKVKPADGRFNGRLFEVLDLVEKPKPENAPSNLAVIGRYILTPEVFETLSTTQFGVGGELQLTDGLCGLLKKQKMYAYVYEGRRHDTGDKLGFLKATIEFALKRPDLGDDLRKYLKDLKL